MVGVVDVCHEGHDRGNVAVLRGGGGHEDADARVTGEVTRAADAVHHVSAADVGGVHVAVDVHFQCGVDRNDTQATDHFRVVGDFLRTENHLAGVRGHGGSQVLAALLGPRERGARSKLDHTCVDQVEDAVLQYFRSNHQVLELGGAHAVQHGVGYGTYTGLQRSQAVGQATRLDFGAQKVEQVVSDSLGVFVRLEQRRRDVRLVGQYDTAHLGRIDRNAHGADSGADVVHRNIFTRILTGGARHVDIVHAFVLTRSRRVQLDDHVFGGLYENRRVAYGTGRNDLTVFGDSSGFNDGVVDLRQDALADQFSHVRQVLVDVQHFAGVDLFALYRVALIRNALVDDAR